MSDGYGVRLQMEFAEKTAQNTLRLNGRSFAELAARPEAIDFGHGGL